MRARVADPLAASGPSEPQPIPAPRRSIRGRWLGDYRVEIVARDGRFTWMSDEQVADGGDDSGPMPSELLFSSVVACFAMAVAWAARKRHQELPDLEVSVHASYDRAARRYDHLEIEAASTFARADPEGFGALLHLAEQVCWITRTIVPGIPIEVRAAAPAESQQAGEP
jgi:uncharacterized OsmC-like protein